MEPTPTPPTPPTQPQQRQRQVYPVTVSWARLQQRSFIYSAILCFRADTLRSCRMRLWIVDICFTSTEARWLINCWQCLQTYTYYNKHVFHVDDVGIYTTTKYVFHVDDVCRHILQQTRVSCWQCLQIYSNKTRVSCWRCLLTHATTNISVDDVSRPTLQQTYLLTMSADPRYNKHICWRCLQTHATTNISVDGVCRPTLQQTYLLTVSADPRYNKHQLLTVSADPRYNKHVNCWRCLQTHATTNMLTVDDVCRPTLQQTYLLTMFADPRYNKHICWRCLQTLSLIHIWRCRRRC